MLSVHQPDSYFFLFHTIANHKSRVTKQMTSAPLPVRLPALAPKLGDSRAKAAPHCCHLWGVRETTEPRHQLIGQLLGGVEDVAVLAMLHQLGQTAVGKT